MKHLIYSFAALMMLAFVFTSCGSAKSADVDSVATDTETVVDSVVMDTVCDTVMSVSEVAE